MSVSESLRPKIMADGKYLIARITDAGQAPGGQKILDDYFRYKDYIHNPEWFDVSAQERWDRLQL